jgi:hypothetical protein
LRALEKIMLRALERIMIAERFDSRTLANMEVALERACETLPVGGGQHKIRRHIASKIIACASRGDTSLGALAEAGRLAAGDLCASKKAS